MIYLQLLWNFVLQIIVKTLYEQLPLRLCLTASLGHSFLISCFTDPPTPIFAILE